MHQRFVKPEGNQVQCIQWRRPRYGASYKVGSGLGTTGFFSKTKAIKMSEERGLINTFGHNVRVIVPARNFHEVKVTATHALLDP